MRKVSLLVILAVLSVVTARAATPIGLGTTQLGLSSSYSQIQAAEATKGWNIGQFSWLGGAYGLTIGGNATSYNSLAYLETPLELPANANITVKFKQNLWSFSGNTISFGDILSQGSGFIVRVDGDTDWTYIKPACDETATSGPIATEVSLNAYSGKTVQIGFLYVADAAFETEWELMDVEIEATEGGDTPVTPTAPGTITFSPADGTAFDAAATVTVTSTDAEKLQYTVNDGTVTEVDGATAEIAIPGVSGTYTVNVTATNEGGTATGTATYTVSMPKPGEITFDPTSGSEVTPGATVTISSANAGKLAYAIGNGEITEVEGTSATATLPTTAGTYTLNVTAYRGDETVTGTATYTVSIPKPGEITFDPASGSIVKPGSTVTLTSANAESITYTVEDGEAVTVTGATATITMPSKDGEYTVNATATLGTESVDASATYIVETPNLGEITFDPAGGIVQPGREVKITCGGAIQIKMQLNDDVTLVELGDTFTFNLPTTPGSYNITATAVMDETQEITAQTSYTIQEGTTATGGDFILLNDASKLSDGMKIVIADPNHTPQTIMCRPGEGQTAFPQGDATITNDVVVSQGSGIVLPVEAAADGWYLGDANGYLYCAEDGTLSLSTEQKSIFSIAFDGSLAKIVTSSTPEGLTLCHSTVATTYSCYADTDQSGVFLPSIYYQYTETPGVIVFDPTNGIVQQGDVVTIYSEGASSITYSYEDLYGNVIETKTITGSTAKVTLTQSGDLSATANNPNGYAMGTTTFYITEDPTINFTDLNEDDAFGYYYWRHYSYDDHGESTTRVWNWGAYPEGSDTYCLTATGSKNDGEDTNINLDSYTYTIMPIDLTGVNAKKFIVEFEQESSSLQALEAQGCRFIIREFSDNYPTDPESFAQAGWEFINPFIGSDDDADGFTETSLNISAYNGKQVQIGFYYNSEENSAEPWHIRNLVVRHTISTSIEEIIGDDTTAPVEYYNLNGLRVAGNNLAPGIYIRRQGNHATKILVQ